MSLDGYQYKCCLCITNRSCPFCCRSRSWSRGRSWGRRFGPGPRDETPGTDSLTRSTPFSCYRDHFKHFCSENDNIQCFKVFICCGFAEHQSPPLVSCRIVGEKRRLGTWASFECGARQKEGSGDEKSRIQETLNLSTCVDSSTNTKTDRSGVWTERKKKENIIHVSYVRCQVSGIRCQGSSVRCHVSHVACHLSPTPTAKDPPPAGGGSAFPRLHTHRHTTDRHCNLETEWAQRANSVKIQFEDIV